MNDWSDAEVHVERAHELYEDGKWAEAERELRHALSINPYRPEWHFNLGLTLEAAGRYGAAFEAFRDCHELDREDHQALLMLGVNALRLADLRGAVAWLEKAQQADASNADAFVHRIEAYTRLGDHEQAELMFYMAQQVNPEHAGAYANMAESLLARGLNDRAVWCLREAGRIDPGLPRIGARLAEAYAATGRLERARQLLIRELRKDPGDIHVLLDLGCLLCDMDRLADAAEKFRRVLELEPDHADAHFYLGDVAERQGQFELAMEEFGLVLRIEESGDHADSKPAGRQSDARAESAPTEPRRFSPMSAARVRLASLLVRRQRGEDLDTARTLLRAEFRAFDQQRGAAAPVDTASEATASTDGLPLPELEYFGQTLLDARLPNEARAVLDRVVNHQPEPSPQTLHALSVACFMLNDQAAGVRKARACLRLDPKFVPAMHNIAVACVQARNYRRARVWLTRAIETDPDDASLRRLRVQVRVRSVAQMMRGRGARRK
ncbi:MAG: tetratricopeptide repeat protein [Phycisphaerales bacterium]|nr:tetratricopeptide repeat protein [Phycisphaerales bacterium]